jgi:hypothetical protein
MSLREAAQQALESLEYFVEDYQSEYGLTSMSKYAKLNLEVITALRAALEQPEQEPVAWMVYTQDGKSVCVTDNPADFIEWRSFPLFNHPPRREWRGLTEEDRSVLFSTHFNSPYELVNAIEAALKERNA